MAVGCNCSTHQDEIEIELEMRYHAAIGGDVDGLFDPSDVE